MDKDPLEKFIVDERESLDLELLASLIDGFMKFTKEGEIIFEESFSKEKGYKKILLYLLGRKVISIKKLKKDFKEESKPAEIAQDIGVPQGSVTKGLSRDLKKITKSENGAHKIPPYNLYKCKEVLKKK